MSWFHWPNKAAREANLKAARAAEEAAQKQHSRVVSEWPLIRQEAGKVSVILAENGLAAMFWDAMQERRRTREQ